MSKKSSDGAESSGSSESSAGSEKKASAKLCKVYRSTKRAEMYLFVTHENDLSPVPEALLARFGKPEFVMSMALGAERKLARSDMVEVMAALKGEGFYLQMPPGPEVYMANVGQKNEKLPRA